jgi:ferredoxin
VVSAPTLKVEVGAHKCVGAGQCVRTVPEVFDQLESDGSAMLIEEYPEAELKPYLEKVVRLCPARAIRIIERDQNNQETNR